MEERLAVAECDGHESPEQAKRIAYQDAFIAVLIPPPLKNPKNEPSTQVWLNQKIQKVRAYLDPTFI